MLLQAEEMIEDVRTAFIENTKHLSWMDEETRKKAEDKAEAITKMMGGSNENGDTFLFFTAATKGHTIESGRRKRITLLVTFKPSKG